jgi:hypothetical protein
MIITKPAFRGIVLALPLLGALLGGCTVRSIEGTGTPVATATASAVATTSAKGTLTGTVLAGPTCPVETVPSTCPPKPVTGRVVNILTESRQPVTTATTDARGEFSIALSPGTYLVEVTIVQGQVGMRQESPVRAVVVAGQTAHVEVMLDTGIR